MRLHFELLKFIGELETHQISGQLWIDGSFACEKQAPGDVDVVLIIWHEIFDTLSVETKNFLNQIQYDGYKYEDIIDAFVCIEYPKNDPMYQYDNPNEYVRLYGTENSGEWLKGFAVVEI